MEIIIAKNSGFCFGVTNSVEKTKQELSEMNKTELIYCLGELVHNEQVIKSLEDKGLIIEENILNIPNNSKVIIRAHGTTPETYRIAKKNNIELIDLTCPKVTKIHQTVEKYKQKGYYIIIIGIENHPEIIGTKGFSGKDSFVLQDESEIKELIDILKKEKIKDVIIVSQTTFSFSKFNILNDKILKQVGRDLEEINIISIPCICNATKDRQDEVEKISKEVECIIVVGGKNSSNTEKLFNIAKKQLENSIWINSKDEISLEYIKQFSKIGIVSGASTPMEVINEIIEYIQNEN